MISNRLVKRLVEFGIPKPKMAEKTGMNYVDIAIDGKSLSYIPDAKLSEVKGDPYAKKNRVHASKSTPQYIMNRFTNQQYGVIYREEFELAFNPNGFLSRTQIRKKIGKDKDNIFKEYLYHLTQKELIKHIKSLLKQKNIPYKQDDYGNIWSIRHEGKPTFVAHLDTVIGNEKRFRVPLSYYKVGKGDSTDIQVSRDGFVLGADDRAGVNLIINYIEHLNFVFCLDEEIGRKGSKALAKVEEFKEDCKKTNFFIQLDRKGNSDILGNVHGYCTKELYDELKKILTKHTDNRGSFTDIDSFTEIAQGVNLSIGYYKQHTINEYLSINDFYYINGKILELSKVEGHAQTYEKPVTTYSSGGGNKYSRWDYGWDKCDECGYLVNDVTYYKGRWVCNHCKEKLQEKSIEQRLLKKMIPVKSKEYSNCAVCGKKHGAGDSVIFIKALGITVCQDCTKELSYIPMVKKEGLDG